jgi:hypothetical protein
MYHYVCNNEECPELGVPRISLELLDAVCMGTTPSGPCFQPLTTDGVEHPPIDEPATLDERVTELEAFNEALVTALAAHDIVVDF